MLIATSDMDSLFCKLSSALSIILLLEKKKSIYSRRSYRNASNLDWQEEIKLVRGPVVNEKIDGSICEMIEMQT